MRFDQVTFITSYGTPGQLQLSTLPEVVFSGRSNVGKSSLLNKLFQRKNLARVSATPGKTVTINFFQGDGVYFVDLPGYGYAKRSFSEKQRWAKLMEAYFQSERRIALVVQIIDMRHKPSVQDYEMLEFLQHNGYPFLIVATKSDKLNRAQYEKREQELRTELSDYPDAPMISFSAVSGQGLPDIRDAIAAAVRHAADAIQEREATE